MAASLYIVVAGDDPGFDTFVNGVALALFTAPEIAKLRSLQAHARLAARRRELSEFADHARRELRQAGIAVTELPMIFETTLDADAVATLSRILETDFLDAQPEVSE